MSVPFPSGPCRTCRALLPCCSGASWPVWASLWTRETPTCAACGRGEACLAATSKPMSLLLVNTFMHRLMMSTFRKKKGFELTCLLWQEITFPTFNSKLESADTWLTVFFFSSQLHHIGEGVLLASLWPRDGGALLRPPDLLQMHAPQVAQWPFSRCARLPVALKRVRASRLTWAFLSGSPTRRPTGRRWRRTTGRGSSAARATTRAERNVSVSNHGRRLIHQQIEVFNLWFYSASQLQNPLHPLRN